MLPSPAQPRLALQIGRFEMQLTYFAGSVQSLQEKMGAEDPFPGLPPSQRCLAAQVGGRMADGGQRAGRGRGGQRQRVGRGEQLMLLKGPLFDSVVLY